MKTQQKGFTLIELLITIAIIGALSAVAVPAFLDYLDGSKANVVKQNCDLAKRMLTAEFGKEQAFKKNSDLEDILNGDTGDGASNFSPYDDTVAAFAIDAANDTPNTVAKGQVAFAGSPTLTSNTFNSDNTKYLLTLVCDFDGDGSNDAGEQISFTVALD